MPTRVPVLFAHSSAHVGGANMVLLRLFERLDRSKFMPLSVIPAVGRMEEELRVRDVPYQIVDVCANGQSGWRQAYEAFRLAFRFRRFAPRILHANEWAYRVASFGTPRGKRVCHIHHPAFSPRCLAWLLRRSPHLIITASEFMKSEVLRSLPSDDAQPRLEIVPNPIDGDFFAPSADVATTRTRLGLDPTGNHITIAGALSRHKGHVCFLRMARDILQHHAHTTFHIVGDDRGRDREFPRELQQLAAELQVSNRVRFWGHVPTTTVRDLMAVSDLFVLPTTEEGFCLVLPESQACGVPVLATRMQPLDEVVEDGRTGFLLPRDDYQAFADKAVAS